jgi:hypothetical protein
MHVWEGDISDRELLEAVLDEEWEESERELDGPPRVLNFEETLEALREEYNDFEDRMSSWYCAQPRDDDEWDSFWKRLAWQDYLKNRIKELEEMKREMEEKTQKTE